MSNNYGGYLLRFGSTGVIPREFFTDYKSVPNHRMESYAERDQNGDFHRATMPHFKTSIRFTLRMLTLDDKITLQTLMGYSSSDQRRVQVTYWNDETNEYKTSWFYLPDIEWSVKDFDAQTIYYNPTTVELIEY